ncbi:hypothetical protein HRG_006955 [Hirsutella rhossiliensis]|uniref:TRI14-like protein n=1 Tax=Hirsutella rhossiliensis TaxID=111463 RepID=A0A9P8MV98_9HYPO|nr:uncharacterized protein HRG_06955 [Hirsutella rhossiliensis]KAH0961875.1 hypothetical protein HRG_06955 [Hirsutella rhossiliensis]
MLAPLLFLLLSAPPGSPHLTGARSEGHIADSLYRPPPGFYAAPSCDVSPGNKTVNRFQLYPENAEFDPKRCLVYFSVLWNASVAVWDPVKNEVVGSITDDRFSGRPELHASGVQLDAPRDQLSIMFNAGNAFNTLGRNIAGENNLVRYDLKTKRVLWAIDLSRVTSGAYGGFQDIEHDGYGNTFVCGTFPPSLMHVNITTQAATPWWLGPSDSQVVGINGIAMYQNRKLLGAYQTGVDGSQLVWFDIHTPGSPNAIPVKQGGRVSNVGESLDAAVLPAMYGGKILLVSDAFVGTVILHSNDHWATAEKLGAVPNGMAAEGIRVVTAVQVGQRILCVFEFFGDANVKVPGQPAGAGNRSEFPLQDITDDIDRLLPSDLRGRQ